MNAIEATKSRLLNLLEGSTLTAIFQAVPTFAAAALALKLAARSEIVGDTASPVMFVTMGTAFYVAIMALLGTRFPRFLKNSYEPLFFDATLSFQEKVARWRVQPMASLQLAFQVVMLSVLAVASL